MSVVTAASVVTVTSASSVRVDPADVDLPRTHDVDITAWLALAAAQQAPSAA